MLCMGVGPYRQGWIPWQGVGKVLPGSAVQLAASMERGHAWKDPSLGAGCCGTGTCCP